MAKRKSTRILKSKTTGNRNANEAKNVDIYEHIGSKRLNNPQVGLVNTKTEKVETKKTYRFDPHLDPQLQWAGKDEKSAFELPTVSLHVHERIDPRTIIEVVQKSPEKILEQLNLFNRPINKLNFLKEIQFYQHEKDWANRLIAGDSLLVMNSLIEKEAMAGKVQTIYFDPPYGITYKSNFQPFVDKREVGERDEDLNTEPETIRAFRDTWELGIHSYLSYIRERLLLCRDLLSESGSIFLQISDENLHRVRIIMDEVFGSNNCVVTIPVKKKGSQKSSLIDPVNDYLLWYSKSPRDSGKVKFNPIYEPRPLDFDTAQFYANVEFPDGTVKKITDVNSPSGENYDYRYNLQKLFIDYPNVRLFKSDNITSGGERKNQSLPFKFNNKVYNPGAGKCWKTTARADQDDISGMERLAIAGRILAGANQLRYKGYLDDFGYQAISNWWDGLGGASNPIYVVQTNPEIIKRCILMTSDPGDIVFDPTCGSGTTAVVAEEWGRKWITCDTSRVAITLAKQRIMTQIFDYFALKYPEDGVGSGFIYKKIPHITLGGIANDKTIKRGLGKDTINELIKKNAPQDELLNEPIKDATKARVTGPFTVEAVPAPVVRELSDEVVGPGSINDPRDWISELLNTGIRLKNKKFLKFARLEPMQGTKWLHADGETNENPPQRVVVSFGTDFSPLEQRQVELALQEAEKIKPSPTVIVFASFQFDPEAAKDIDEVEWGGVSVLKVLMNADLFTDDLKKKRSSNESFWLVGQPDVDVKKITSGENKGKLSVKVNGFDYYNTKTGSIESGGHEKIAMWMLDTDYDGRSLLPRQAFFPLAGENEGWSKLAKSLRAEIDEDLIEAYRGGESLPFEVGENKKIAVKIIDNRGIESLIVKDIE